MRKSRGITLILALFVAFLLSTLSLAFITLMLEDSRGGRSSSQHVMATEAAEWGVQTTLSYMGRGGNWQKRFDPTRFLIFDLLDPAMPNGPHHLKGFDQATSSNSEIDVKVVAGTGVDSQLRKVSLANPSLPPGFVLSLDGEYLAKVAIDVAPASTVLSSYGPGQALQYVLTSRAELFRRLDVIGPHAVANPEPVAVSVLEAQVRPDLETDALIHVQNMRSWDVQSSPIGNVALKDRILIPPNYTSSGQVRITGMDPLTDSAHTWYDAAGNMRFVDAESSGLKFDGLLSIHQGANLNRDGSPVTTPSSNVFRGGLLVSTDYVPMPTKDLFLTIDRDNNGVIDTTNGGAPGGEQGLMAAAASDKPSDPNPQGLPYVRGTYRVDKPLITAANALHGKAPNLSSPTPVENQDYRPGVPEVEVILRGPDSPNGESTIEVNVWEANFGDGGSTPGSTDGNLNTVAQGLGGGDSGPLGEPFKLSQLKNGVLLVEGGQVVVRSEGTPFKGRLQVVSSSDPTRRRTGAGASESYGTAQNAIYDKAAATYFDNQKQRRALSPDDPNYLAEADFKAPPYTGDQLHAAVGAPLSGPGLYWPPPGVGVEREGNLVVGGDVTKEDNGSSVIGLTAENFVLLSDRTMATKSNPKELKIDAVLTSFDHSVQMDWFNTSNNRSRTSSNESAYKVQTTPGFDGIISVNGSLISPFSDVEGDLHGKGYPSQHFAHDDVLKNWTPPFQPRTMLSDYPNTQIAISWIIVNFLDRTSLKVYQP